MRDELCVARMVDGFYPHDNVHQIGLMVLNVFDQFGLCIAWSDNKNRTSVCN